MDIAQGVDADHQRHQGDHDQEKPGQRRRGNDANGGAGQCREQGGNDGSRAQARQKGQAGHERAHIETPIGRMHGRVHDRQPEVTAHGIGQGAAQQPQSRRQQPQAQQGKRQAAECGTRRRGLSLRVMGGLQPYAAHGVHIQPDEYRGGRGHQQQAEHASGRGGCQQGLHNERARFRQEEGRTAHSGQQAQAEERSDPGLPLSRAGQLVQRDGGRLRESGRLRGREARQRGQRQQPG